MLLLLKTLEPVLWDNSAVVEDEPLVAVSVCDALTDAGAEIVTAHDLATALEAALNGTFAAATLDLALAAGD